jgi:hypothetical protein
VSYFDHVRCHACKAMLAPESLGSVAGQGLSCPKCGAALSLPDLFGLSDAFSEDEEQPMSLDDLVTPRPMPHATPGARPPSGPAAKEAEAPSGALEAMRALKRR